MQSGVRLPLILLAAASAVACDKRGPGPSAVGGPQRTAEPADEGPDASPRDDAAPDDRTVPPQDDAGTAGLITDEECVARGGRVITEETYAHEGRREGPVTPFRVCRIPSPDLGNPCRDDSECRNARCRCTGDLGGPNVTTRPELQAHDGEEAVGVCDDSHLTAGVWWCLVSDGRVQTHGIIID